MGVDSNRQEEAIASSWNMPNKKTTRLINCVVCRKPRGGIPGYDSDQGRKFLFPYLTNRRGEGKKARERKGEGKVKGKGICLLLNLGLSTPLMMYTQATKKW